MRDKIKKLAYFEEYITQEKMRIDKFQTKLDANEVSSDRIFPVKEKILSLRFQVLIAKYSMGENIEKLREEYNILLSDIEKYWYFDSYTSTLWMVSLAILLDVSMEDVGEFIAEVKKYYSDEWLMSFLISYYDNNEVFKEKKVLFDKPYGKLKRIVDMKSDIEKVNQLKKYLQEDWYKGHKDTGWYDLHKCKEKLYYGYWSFESAAIVRILGLNDAELKEVKFYPYDMVYKTE